MIDESNIKKYWDQLQNENLLNDLAYTDFTGYHATKGMGQIVALINEKGERVSQLTGVGFVVFDQTAFYAEGGGQPSDHGYLIADGVKICVYDLNKKIYDHIYLHLVDCGSAFLNLDMICEQFVDAKRRWILTCNHSGQHLFSDAMNIVANKVLEERSIGIKLDYFFSEFFQNEFFTIENILKARDLTQSWMKKKIPSKEIYMNLEEARAKNLITREYKYGDYVRVVEFENTCADLCGGTHIDNTDQLECLEVLDISIKSNVTNMKVTTNLAACQAFFKTCFDEIKKLIDDNLTKMQTYRSSEKYSLPQLKCPTKYEELLELRRISSELAEAVKNASKEFKKMVQERISNVSFDITEEPLGDYLWCNYTVNEPDLENNMVRGKLTNELKKLPNGIICFVNSAIPTSVLIMAHLNLKNQINLKACFDDKQTDCNLDGGGTNFFLDIKSDSLEHMQDFIAYLKTKF